MKITEVAVKKPVFGWMIMAAFIIFGAISFNQLGVSERPDIDFPVVSVSVTWEGAAPEVVELDIIDALEGAVLGVDGIRTITSRARRGRATLNIDFAIGTDIDVAIQEIQSAISQAQRNLPTDIDPPTFRKSNPEDRPIMWISVTSDQMSRRDLMAFVRDQVRDRFLIVDGVSDIRLGGYVEPNLRVWASERDLRRYDMTVTDIINTIRNEHLEVPAGIFETSRTEYNVRIFGEASSVEEFENLSINQRGGAPNFNPIPLSYVARIEDDLEDVRRISRVNARPAVGLGIQRQRGENAVAVAQAVKARMKEVEQILPEGMEMGINYDGTVFIEESIDELKFTLLMAGFMTALVVWFFLGSFAATLNVVLSIPTVVIGTFIAFYAFGYTLNTFTMLGLTLAVGLIVDDNIMILENITRKFKQGKDKITASVLGTKEIAFAALAASSAIVAIFLPIGLMPGIVGQYFFQFAVVISVAIAFSYIDAVTLTPMRTSLLLGSDKKAGKRFIDKAMDKLEWLYRKTLRLCFRFKWITILASILVFVVSYPLFNSLEQQFVPAQDQSRIQVIMRTPPGSSLEYTDSKVGEVEAILNEMEEVSRFFVAIGGWTGGESNVAFSFVTLHPPDSRPENPELGRRLSQQEFINYLRGKFRENIEGMFVMVRDPSLSGLASGGDSPIEYNLIGDDWGTLIDLSERAQEIMRDSGMAVDVDSNFDGMIPELAIVPDRQKAIERGVSVREIGQTLQAMVAGIVAGKYAQGGRRYDIRVKIEDDQLTEIEDISNIMIRNNRGELVALSEVTKIKEQEGLLGITRSDRSRAITLSANLAPGVSQTEALDTIAQQIREELPSGYGLLTTGSAEAFQDSFFALFVVFGMGILISYMVLASQFNSFIHPFIILMALPFSMTGALAALLLGGQSLNIYSMIGIILLMGIVMKNSIILVDFTNQKREQGMSVFEALMEACPIRLRPIVMTSISTVAGTLPAALALGPGAETRVPMALAVIGGVILSTALTLIVIPTIYLAIAPRNRKITEIVTDS